jgi:hypothetical protein
MALSLAAQAQQASRYHSGKLLQMESVPCVVAQQSGSTPAHTNCDEYVLEGDGVMFHLQPKKAGGAQLLPVGKTMEYRLVESHFFLHVNGRDREFSVVAMEPRESGGTPVHSAQKINHLQ